MVDAQRQHKFRFPFFIVFLIVLIIGNELFFGTLQIQSTLRGSAEGSTNNEMDQMVNETVEMLLARLKDSSLYDERLALLESRLSSLETTVLGHINGNDGESREERTPRVSEVSRLEAPEAPETPDSPEPFCVTWETNMDDWWTHHPDWYVSKENNTHYCFSLIEDAKKAAVFRKLYDVQFKTGDCSNVTTKRMWSSGWGADFENVVDGLKNAYDTGIPTQMHVMEGAWHYAGKKDASRPVCATKDMYCYFLNLTRCPANPERPYEGAFMSEDFGIGGGIGRWLLEYATRPQTWLRREVYKFSSKVKIKTPCTAIHVRRTDIVLHEEYSRRYRKMSEYVDVLENGTKNLLLLTDDQNAVEEAQSLFPSYNWMYIDRPRHRGTEGGWENQIPSDDPKMEVIILLTIFRLVRQCSTLIHTHSGLARVLKGEMEDALKGKEFRRVDLDENDPNLFSANNSLTVNVSMPFS
jgi:hypothetical protein